ncbi:hypothetical protein PSJ72_11150 [Escherichia coli]|nr:hypothetical protein [Escherichia coli]
MYAEDLADLIFFMLFLK